jgi:predicted lipid-binding transport protein (Tim44 family)
LQPLDSEGWYIILFVLGIIILVFVYWYFLARPREAPAPSRQKTPANSAFSFPTPPCPREDHHRAWPKQAPRTLPVPPLEDLILSAEEVEEKALSTLWLLDELAQRDPVFDPSSLEAFITATFLQMQRCWEERDYGPVHDLLAPSLLAEHEALLQVMRRDRLINRLEGLKVRRLEFIHVCHAETRDGQEITALITFDARSYYVDDGSGDVRGGSQKVIPCQEFWTFRRQGDAWQLYTIQRDASVHLDIPNYVAPLTEVTR